MFSLEERTRAVKLLIQYDLSYADVIRELGYPTRGALRNWYTEYCNNGRLHEKFVRKSKYSMVEKRNAVKYYIEHGKSLSRTCRVLGYPSRPELDTWIKQIAPEEKKHCSKVGTTVRYTQEHKELAVISLCARSKPASDVAADYGVTRGTLYNWKDQLLKEGSVQKMKNNRKRVSRDIDTKNLIKDVSELNSEKEHLELQLEELQNEVYRLKLEGDIYEKAAEIIKKDQGINLNSLQNREKAIIINALRDRHQLKNLLKVLNMAKSSYCYQVTAMKSDKYAKIRTVIAKISLDSSNTYGYRRVHSELQTSNMVLSEKVVRRIMKEENLVVKTPKRKRYSSYKGEINSDVANIINRNFHSDKPNVKWLTDITEFSIPAGKVYLSPIIDCFDGLPVSWVIGTSPNAELVNTMLEEAISTLNKNEKPIVHSDRGCHYQWPGWIERIENAGLIRSMSKKGCSPDNAACEGFFGRLKNEMFYGHSWKGVTIKEFISILNKYIQWYAEKRIKLSLGGMSPLNYRRSLGLVV